MNGSASACRLVRFVLPWLSAAILLLQAIGEGGRPVWAVVYLISHRDLTAQSTFTVLSSGNGTTLTLSGSHIVYTADVTGSGWVPAAAHGVQARKYVLADRSRISQLVRWCTASFGCRMPKSQQLT